MTVAGAPKSRALATMLVVTLIVISRPTKAGLKSNFGSNRS
jgi:hypothetical protein